MARHVMKSLVLLTALTTVNAYWLMGIENFITTERLDPIVNPGKVSGHAHSILGGSNFRMNTNTAQLRQSECTSIPIPEDKSNYWFPHLYFQWNNGSFTSLDGGAVIYYLFNDKPGTTTAFPDDFRMLSGDPTLRTYDPNSFAQQAITFLCLDFNGVTTRHNSLPAKSCPSGIRAQVNFPSCWDGKNLDSPDHKSHVAFLSGGPDSGSCSDPNYPVTLPRIFIEVYWASNDLYNVRSQAMNSEQPFVYAYGDPTGYGYHADFINGWDKGVLQRAVDGCNCNQYGDPTCCVDKGIFHMNKGKNCRITKTIDEATTGTLPKLPGNNPVQKEGVKATMFSDTNTPTLLSPVYAYTGNSPTMVGKPVPPASGGPASSAAPASSSSTRVVSSSASASPSSSPVASPSPSSPPVPSSAPAPSSSKPPSTSGQAPPASGRPTSAHETASTAPSSVPVSSPTKSSSPVTNAPTHSPTTPAPPAPTSSSNCDDGDDDDGDDDDGDDDDGDDDDGDDNDNDNGSVPSPTHPSAPVSSSSVKPSPSVSSPTKPSSPVTHAPSPTPTDPAPSEPEDDCDDDEENDNNEDDAPPSPNVPAPTSPGTGSNSPTNNSGSGTHSGDSAPDPGHSDPAPPKPPVPTPVPATTLVVGGDGAPQSPAPTAVFPPSPNSAPTCPGGKFRHKLLREQKAQAQKRALHHARAFHDNSRRFTRPHVHVGAL